MQGFGFPYSSLEQLLAACESLGFSLPWQEDLSPLLRPVRGQGYTLKNALAVHPMEGADAAADGSPTPAVFDRYTAYAKGGAGLIWLEACAVSENCRANPRQLWLTEQTLPSFRRLVQAIREAAPGEPPLLILQLTHSGRFSKPVPHPATPHPILNPHQGFPMTMPCITDEELPFVEDAFAHSAMLCREAGFDGVDIKSCHLYLFSELLGAYRREGPYGGPTLENRMRVQLNSIRKARRAAGEDYLYAARNNLFDGFPGGFATNPDGSWNREEALQSVQNLKNAGITLLNITMGTPYYNPNVNRPYASGPALPPAIQPENPLLGVNRLLSGCRAVQTAFPDLPCVATGTSYLRQFAPQIAAALVASGGASVVGFGRQALAYPDFANDIRDGGMKKEKSCVTCGLCTRLMRVGKCVGCAVRNPHFKAECQKLIREQNAR